MTDLVFLFPGQGSQYVGMGKAFYDSFPSVRELFAQASDIVDQDLAHLCFEGPEETLVQTDHVQPAITLVNLAVLQVLREEGFSPRAAAGHSLGEYAALCAAGVFSFADTMRLVQVRGRAMQDAANRNPGGMVAVLGLDVEILTEICAEVSDTGSVEVANHNSPSQVALTGEADALRRASEIAKQRGAKFILPLKVSGPWHSRFMADAQGPLRTALEGCEIGQATIPVIANVTGRPYGTGDVVDLLTRQLISPVRWARSMATLIGDGHKSFAEVGPGRVLTGLFRDIDRAVTAVTVQDSDTFAKFRVAMAGQ